MAVCIKVILCQATVTTEITFAAVLPHYAYDALHYCIHELSNISEKKQFQMFKKIKQRKQYVKKIKK